MGITLNSALQLMQELTALQGSLDNAAMIGRQQFFSFERPDYDRACDDMSLSSMKRCVDSYPLLNGSYIDSWLSEVLGGAGVTSFDASGYEGAQEIHDFNFPIAERYLGQFDLILDGGSSEHIFDVKEAFRSYIKMLRVGGVYVGILPCNQWGGHGFYQLQPEFFYRVFCSEHGFKCAVSVYHERGDMKRTDFPDPLSVGKRLEFRSQLPLSCFVVARKTKLVEPFSRAPQQSDYSDGLWRR